MPESPPDTVLESREAAMFNGLMATARARQQSAQAKSSLAPRFVLDSAQSMAAHLGLSEPQMQARLEKMALWQLYLPASLGRTWDFDDVRENMPWSYERVRAALAPMQTRPQLVSTVCHMAAFPIVNVLVGSVWRDMHAGPLHLLVASRNMSWLKLENNRWVNRDVEVVSTDAAGLRRLLNGLRSGEIRRLLIMADGPQAPGAPGVRALGGVSPALGIRTALLAKVHALGIPLIPFTHEWDGDRPVVTPRAPLDPVVLTESETMDAMAGHIEGLLGRHPEQWLNWSAAAIRT